MFNHDNPNGIFIQINCDTMEISKENTLKIIEEVNSRKIDIEKTIRRAAEFQGERGLSVFKKKCTPIYYDIFSDKRKYTFDFLSERFFKVMNRYYISNEGIFITLAKGYNKITVDHGSEDYNIKTLDREYGFSTDESHLIASDFGIKITEKDGEQKVEFGCMYAAIACGYGGVWAFNLINRDGKAFNYSSLNNPVNQVAIEMMFDEIVFED